MSHPSEHKRRHIAIRDKLLRYLKSDAFRENRPCGEMLGELVKASRRHGRWEGERVNRFREYHGEKERVGYDDEPWFSSFPDWELLRTHYEQQLPDNVNKTPGSIGWHNQEFLKRCIIKRAR